MVPSLAPAHDNVCLSTKPHIAPYALLLTVWVNGSEWLLLMNRWHPARCSLPPVCGCVCEQMNADMQCKIFWVFSPRKILYTCTPFNLCHNTSITSPVTCSYLINKLIKSSNHISHQVVFLLSVFHREIVSEMGEMGVLGPTIKGESKQVVHYSVNQFSEVITHTLYTY